VLQAPPAGSGGNNFNDFPENQLAKFHACKNTLSLTFPGVPGEWPPRVGLFYTRGPTRGATWYGPFVEMRRGRHSYWLSKVS